MGSRIFSTQATRAAARAALTMLLCMGLWSGCVVAAPVRSDAGRDAGVRDAGRDAPAMLDAGSSADAPDDVSAPFDAGLDAPPSDSGADAGAPDAGADTGAADAGADSAVDAGIVCAISTGDTVVLDGVSDIAAYPGSQLAPPGATVGVTDVLALTWDRDSLYMTMTSDGFLDAFEPLHVYLEAGTTLPSATPSRGKEYGGLTAELPFSPTHVVAVRRTSDSGTGGPYDGAYLPGGAPAWGTRSMALDVGVHVFVSSDGRTLSVRVPWSAIGGCPTRLRLVAHVVHGDVGNEWKDVVPTTHMPWVLPGGGYYDIDLRADPAVSGWTLR